jgi:hypothetical protein
MAELIGFTMAPRSHCGEVVEVGGGILADPAASKQEGGSSIGWIPSGPWCIVTTNK